MNRCWNSNNIMGFISSSDCRSVKDMKGGGTLKGYGQHESKRRIEFYKQKKKGCYGLGYYSMEFFVVLSGLTASLLVLPLVLPPLPPPPLLVLLLPIGILAVLMALALLPAGVVVAPL